MKPIIKRLILIYIIIVLIKIIFSFFISSPTGFWDEYIYIRVSRSFYYFQNFNLDQNPSPFYPPLYSIIISIAFILKDMVKVYSFIKIINAIISSLVIIPAYLLTKEFLKEKQILPITALITLLPISFSFSNYILAENLFVPIFLSAIYFIYTSLTKNLIKEHILASIFIGISFLTKNLGLVLVMIYPVSHLLNKIIYKQKIPFKEIILGLIIIILIISPWLLRNYLNFGPSAGGIIEKTFKDNLDSLLDSNKHSGYYLYSLLNWIIIHIVALSIISGIIFFFSLIFLVKNIKEKNNLNCFFMLTILVIVSYILVLSNNALGPQPSNLPVIFKFFAGKPILRYIEILVPLILILGTIGLNKYIEEPNKKLKKTVLFSLPFFIISSQITLTSLFPINNSSMTHLGLLKTFFIYLFTGKLAIESQFNWAVYSVMLIVFIIIPFSFFLISKLDFKKINYVYMAVLVFLIIFNFSILVYKSGQIEKSDQMALGLWFNENNKEISNILFDIETKGYPLSNNTALIQVIEAAHYKPQYMTLSGFWMNDNLFFDSVKNSKDIDFIITTKELNNLILVKKINKIRIYKVGL